MNTGCKAYRNVNTMGMSQLDLILTVYNGAINFLRQARESFENSKSDEGRIYCSRARKCIVHLYTTLDMEKGRDVAESLARLYAFLVERIDQASAIKSIELLKEIENSMATIKQGWEGLKKKSLTPAEKQKSDSDEESDEEYQPLAAGHSGGLAISA